MISKKHFLLFLILQFSLSAFNQSVPEVLNTAGFQIQNGTTLWDISIGETLTTTISSTSDCSTQGYLQPMVSSGNTSTGFAEQLQFRYYPNPFNDYLIIACERNDLFFSIADITGKTLLEKSTEHTLNLFALSSGLYHLIAHDKSGQIVSVVKICKSPI